jgi:hypothetical protein
MAWLNGVVKLLLQSWRSILCYTQITSQDIIVRGFCILLAIIMHTETAINIGYSCHLLTDDMTEIHVIDADTYEEVENQLREANKKMEYGHPVTNCLPEQPMANGSCAMNGRRMEGGGFAIIINGHSLVSD